jgi:hypothetical protein
MLAGPQRRAARLVTGIVKLGVPVLRLPVLGLPVLGLPVLGLRVLGLPVLRLRWLCWAGSPGTRPARTAQAGLTGRDPPR